MPFKPSTQSFGAAFSQDVDGFGSFTLLNAGTAAVELAFDQDGNDYAVPLAVGASVSFDYQGDAWEGRVHGRKLAGDAGAMKVVLIKSIHRCSAN